MNPLVPLQFGVPGAMELLVILFIAVLYGLPILVVVGLFYYLRRIDRNLSQLLELQDGNER